VRTDLLESLIVTKFCLPEMIGPIALWWISIIIYIMFSIDLGLRQWSWSNIIGSAVTYMYLHVVKALNPANPSTRRRVGTRQRASKEAYLPARCFLRDFVYRQPVEGDIKPKSRLHWQYTVHLARPSLLNGKKAFVESRDRHREPLTADWWPRGGHPAKISFFLFPRSKWL